MSESASNPAVVKHRQIWLPAGMLVLALLGLADASYLAANHWLGRLPACHLVKGCSEVLTSSYATIGPVPVAFLGSLYYLLVVILLISYFESGREEILRWTARLTVLGLVASIYFVLVMALVLRSYCQYCLVSALSSTLIFGLGMMVLRQFRRRGAGEI